MITNRQLVYKCISQLSQRQRNGGNLAPAGAGYTTLDFMQTRYSFVHCIKLACIHACKLMQSKAQARSSKVGCGCGCVKCQDVNLKGILSSISIRNKLENLISEKLV